MGGDNAENLDRLQAIYAEGSNRKKLKRIDDDDEPKEDELKSKKPKEKT